MLDRPDRLHAYPERDPLRTRRLGSSRVEVTELTLGTWGFAEGAYGAPPAGSEGSDETLFEATVEAALTHGIRSFDMAPTWGDGSAEATVASVVGARRKDCVYITRVGLHRGPDSVEHRLDPESISAGFARSLERLETDYVDVLLLHDPPASALADGAWAKCCARLRDEGSVKTFGLSCATAAQARVAIGLGAEVLCMPYNILRSDDLDELADDVESSGVGVIARSPLLHGLLAGSYEPGHRFDEGDHRSARWAQAALDRRLEHALALRFLVQQDVGSLRCAALRFALSNSQVSTVTIGPRSPAQLETLVQEVGNPPYLVPELRERIPQVLAAVGAQ